MMSFGTAINTCFKKYVVWKGRATRAEFWWWMLFEYIIMLPFTIWYQTTAMSVTISGTVDANTMAQAMGAIFGPPFWIMLIVGIFLFFPSLSVLIRRLHDTNRSGGFYWLALIPFVGAIILLVFTLLPSDPQGSRFD